MINKIATIETDPSAEPVTDNFVLSIAHRGRAIPRATEQRIEGIPTIWTLGLSDTALARNVQLTRALRLGREMRGASLEKIVLVDDDMMVDQTDVRDLAHYCSPGRPVTALYCPRGQPEIYAVHLYEECLTAGLGACAIHVTDLERLAQRSAEFLLTRGEHAETATEFTTSRSMHSVWLNEDHRLWSRLYHECAAELQILPLHVGHVDGEGYVWRPSQRATVGTVPWCTTGKDNEQ